MMKRLLLLLLACLLARAALANGDIVVIALQGEVSEAQFFFLRRALKEAERDNATTVILEIDTYGGDLRAATKMLDALFKTSVPTLAYINTNAGSAGALISLCTRQIWMAPVSAIGAAAPVMSGGEDLPATMSDKIVSYFSGYFRSAAERNGYNPDIAEAFINKEKEVKIGDTVVHQKGSVLTLSAQDATKIVADKPMLSAGIAGSLEDLVAKANLAGTLRRIEPLGFETAAFWITALAPVFLLIGILGIYLEFKLSGTLVPGVIGVIALLIFFAGHYVAGLAGLEVFVLFFLGLLFVVADLFLFPGTFVLGTVGIVLVFGSMLWAMIDHYPGGAVIPNSSMLLLPMAKLGIAVVASAFVIALLAQYLPQTRMYQRFVLGAANPRGPSFSAASISSPEKVSVGAEGIAKSMLRPSGNAAFGELSVDVVTRGEFIEPNTAIRVLAVEGARIVVETA